MHTVRRCTRCGREDLSESWGSIDDAAKAGAMRAAWACPTCAWPEAELVQASSDATPVHAMPSGSAPHEAPTLRHP